MDITIIKEYVNLVTRPVLYVQLQEQITVQFVLRGTEWKGLSVLQDVNLPSI